MMGDLGREFEWTADVKCEWTAGKLSGSFWGARGGGGGGNFCPSYLELEWLS